ncbi:MBG domain-containing protein [Mucilaginibacter sp. X4EP1]|uniref:MBG domain-containing protein n=1 Tax=Mucilaginibacter sp. X4EP1 TaxID=2723092 RepID=UPI003B001B4E
MKKFFTKGFYVIATIILFIGAALPVRAQLTGTDLETGGLYTALAKDASNNIYVTRIQPGTSGANYEIEKYTNGTGTPAVIYTGLTHEISDYPWGLVVTSTGDIYVSTDFTGGNSSVLKLHFNGSVYVSTTFLSGNFYSALAIDASDNLYTAEYDSGTGKYAVVKYPAGTTTGTKLYDNLMSAAGYTYPTGLTVASNGDVYVADAFSNVTTITDGGHVYKLTAASSYAVSTVSTGLYATALGLDNLGNLYSSENPGSGYVLDEYVGGTGTGTAVYSPLHTNGTYYPWGMAVINNNNIFINDADDGSDAGALIHLVPVGPAITTAGTLSALSTTAGTPSSSENFNVSGTNMTAGVLVTPPAGFEVSTDNVSFTSTVTVGAAGTIAATTVYVRLAASDAVNTYSGNIVLSSSGATSVNLAIPTSTVSTPPPTTISSITDVSSSITNATTVQYTVTFGAAVSGLTTGNFSLITTGGVSGAAIGGISGSGATYTVTVNTSTGDGTIGLNLANATGLTPSITTSLPFTGSIYTIDKTSPTVTISAPSVSYANSSASIQYTVTFTDANMDPSTLSNLTGPVVYANSNVTGTAAISPILIGAFTQSGNNYSIPVTFSGVTGDGTLNFSVPAGLVSDLAGNTSLASAVSGTVIIDNTPPTVTISAPSVSSTATGPVSYTVTYADANFNSSTLIPGNITLNTTGTATGSIAVTGTGLTRTVTISSISGTGSLGISIAAGTSTDLAGNTDIGAGPSTTFTVAQPTTINSITDVTSSLTNATTVQYTATFGAAVAGLTTSNFTLTTTGSVSGASVTTVSGSGTTYTITINTGTGDGTIGLNLDNATGISPAITTSLPFVGSTYTIDKTPPTATISAPSVTYANSSANIQYTVTFTDPNMDVSTLSNFTLATIFGNSQTTGTASIGGLSMGVYTQSGNSYSFPVTIDDVTGDGTISFTVPAGTVDDLAGNGSLASSAAATVIIDNTPPTVTISAPSVSNTSTGPVSYTVTYADANFNSSTLLAGDIALNTTGTATGSIAVTGTGLTRTVTISSISGTGSIGITIAAATSTDLAGNTDIGAGPSGTFTVTPAITASGTLTAMSTTYGTPSGSQSFNVSGSNTSAGILVTPPTGFEVSTDNSTFSSTVTVGAAGTIPSTPVYVRLIASDTPGNYSGDVILSSSGATSVNETIPTSTVSQAALNITADNQNTTYGQALPALTVSYAGFVNGDTQASLTTAATASTTATAASPVGSYTITPSGAVDNNYAITYTNGTLTIGQAALNITADNQTSTYGSALPALTVSYAGFVNGDTQASLTTAATASTTATAASPAGSYTITPSGAVDNNYAIIYTNGTLTIGQAALMVTADNQSSTYGQAIPALTVSYAGFVNGDTQASLTTAATASTTATAASPAGSYTITPSGAVDNNYAITYTNGTLTIGQAALNITADNQNTTYGQALPALTVSYAGFVNGDTQASLTTAATASTTATAASPAGSYTITPSGAVDNNYAITYTNGTLTIGQAALTVTADNQTSIYGQALPALTVSYAGFVNGDTQASLTTAATASTTATAASPAGSYTITPSGAVDNNYAIIYTNGTLTIGQAALNVTADNQNTTYGQALPALTVSYAGFVNGDTQASLTTAATASTTATAASPAGSYTITPSGAVDNNYAITYTNGTLTIGQAALTITADNQSKVYGAAVPTLTAGYAGFVNGDTQASLTTLPTITTSATAASQVAGNPYAITASGAVDNNYTISYVPGILTITTASLSVTADNQNTTYGQALPALTVSYVGFVNGDTQASLTTAATASTTATAASPAGSYTITPSGAVDNNYAITYTNGTLTIGQAALNVTADNQNTTYGQALPALTVSYVGFVNGDTQASLTTAATASTTATAASPAGSYTITPSGAVDNNYAITYTNGTLTIGQAALNVTADNQTSTYGQAIPALTVSYAGFVNGDTQASLTTAATASTTATAASPAGSYTITPSGAVDNNYAITYTNGTLTIGQAALNITADNQTSTYGSALPALTVSYAGFVNGDTQASLTTAATASTTATAASPAGSYTITPSGAVDNNYQITYTNGTLTIGQAALTVTADNQTSIYGQALPALTVTYSGFVNGDTQASLTTAATASTTATAASPVGSYTITPSGAVDNNYAITYTNGTLTIGQAALTVTADNQTSTYGQAIPALTVSYAGFVNGDTQASLTTAATASTTATAASPAGSYTITPSGAVDNNYAITYTNGTLTIGQAALTITADNQSKVYGAAVPTLTASYTGFVNGDTQASLTTAPTLSTTATASSAAGTYPVTASGAADNNYTISYVPGTLTVSQAALTITANNQNSTYGSVIPALTVTYSGFVNGDTQASLTTAATASTTATAASPAGSYTITPSGAVDNNYAITYTNGTLTIGQAVLTITADNQNSTYGSVIPALTVSYSGFVNGDTQASLTTAATASTTATAASPAGSYTITPSGAADNNYAITYANGTLTIGQAVLTVTADNQNTTYGSALPALTVTYSGFVNGDTQASLTTAATASTTATTASPAGSYTITPGGAVDNNYTITYTNGTLTIGQAALTVTANNQSSIYGQAIPALTVAYSGFVNGDTQASLTTAATASTTATAASMVGVYPITPAGAVDNNYAITYVNGTLTITAATATLTFAPIVVKTYGDADFGPGATTSGGETIIYTSSNTAVATIVNGAIHITGAGTTTITATLAASSDYTTIPSISRQLVVNKAQQTISFAAIPNQLKGGHYDLSGVTASSGLAVSFSSSNPLVAAVQGGNSLASFQLGTTDITASQSGDNNYEAAPNVTQPVNVVDAAGDDILVHQAVSPNGDGINDFLYIEGIQNYPENEVTLISRNGVIVYQGFKYDNTSHVFDGHSNITGALQQAGTYFYRVEIIVNGERKSKTGYFVLKYQ